MLFTISFFIIDFFIAKDKKERIKILKTTFIVGIVCLIAFFAAIFAHSILKGEGNIIEGIKKIYTEDYLRRTGFTGNAHEFTGVSKVSIESTFLKTISRYFAWKTPIVTGIPGKYFKKMLFLVALILLYDLIRKKENAFRDIIMLIVFLSVTFSWFIFGKAHSYVHTHMNYVLWYFGFIQICLYLIVQFAIRIINKIIYIVKEKKKISA